MQLELLKETLNVAIYYDSTNDWLYADWRGALTLPLVQATCLALAECFLKRPYPRILNSNQNVTSFTLNVPFWLGTEYLPHLALAGIEYIAWVYTPNLLLKPLIDRLVSRIESPVINLFDDVESAATWLQHTRFHYQPCPETPQNTARRQAALNQHVSELSSKIPVLPTEPAFSQAERISA